MKIDRLTRVNELLRREIGQTLFRVLGTSSFDLAAVTVTRVVTSSDLRSARVFVSIRGHEQERDRMLAHLQRLHGDIQGAVAKTVTLKYTPRIQFALDHSIEEGDHVLDVLSHLGTPPADADPDTEPT